MPEHAELREVEVDRLDRRFAPLRLASPEQISRLRSSIEREGGIRTPLVVSTGVEADRFVLVDGFKRMRILEEAEARMAPVRLVQLDAAAAQAAMLHCNAPHRGLCDLEEAWIVRSLCRDHRMTQVMVARLLRRDKSWVCRRLMLAERLEPSVQEDIRLGLLSGAVARELSRLPRGNQVPVAGTIRQHGLTSRQAALLVTAFLGSEDPAARRDLLADPLRYLMAREKGVQNLTDPRLDADGNEIRKALLTLEGSAGRLIRTLARHAPSGLRPEDARVLAPVVLASIRSTELALERLRQVAADSGLGQGQVESLA